MHPRCAGGPYAGRRPPNGSEDACDCTAGALRCFFQRKRARICILDVLHIKESAAFPRAGCEYACRADRSSTAPPACRNSPSRGRVWLCAQKICCSPADALAIRAAGRQSLSRAGRPYRVHQTNILAPKTRAWPDGGRASCPHIKSAAAANRRPHTPVSFCECGAVSSIYPSDSRR